MNEELIRQCAREGARDYWMERHKETGSGSAKRLAEYSMEGVSDGGEDVGSAYIAIRRYHARAVAPLVEAVEALGAMPEGFCFCSQERVGDDSKEHEVECADVRKALAPLQQEAK